MGKMGGLRFVGGVAGAGSGKAFRAASAIFLLKCQIQVDPPDIGEGCQPGQHISHLQGQFLVGSSTQGTGQLAKFFSQPHECAGLAPGTVLRPKQPFHF